MQVRLREELGESSGLRVEGNGWQGGKEMRFEGGTMEEFVAVTLNEE